MLQHSLKAGMVAVVLALVVQDASAFGHRWGGCGWGGYGCGGYGYGYAGYGYAGYGYGGYGYGGYGYGGYGGYGGWNGGYAGNGYGYAGNGTGVCAAAPLNSAPPANAPKPGMAPNTPATGATSNYDLRPDCLMIAVDLPAEAKVTINDRPTTSTGAHRTYVSSNVLPNTPYQYNLRVEFVRDGKPVSEEKSVTLTAGKTASLNFGAPTAQVADVSTSAQR